MAQAKKLEDTGLKVGDLVLFSSNKKSTGGVIYQIVENTEPKQPATTVRKVMRQRHTYVPETNKYEYKLVECNEYGAWDAKGRRIMAAAVNGFVRIRPLFEFFATSWGKDPSGKGKTLIIGYDELYRLKPVDLVVLGTKYMELGNIIKDFVRKGTDGNG